MFSGGRSIRNFLVIALGIFILTALPVYAAVTVGVPDAPTGLDVEETANGKVTVTWDEVDDATEYIVYVESGEDDEVWEFTRKTCKVTLKNLIAGNTYIFYVTAVNDEGESEPSDSEEITMSEPDVPDAPTGLELKEEADGRLTITWDEVDEATGYTVYVEYKDENKKWEFERKTCQLKLKGLIAGATYKVYVTAVNDEGESEPSDSEEITMSEPDVPDAPTGLELKEEADGRLTITWDEVDEATGYTVYVEYKAEDKKWEFARKTCQLKLKGLQAGATYKVYVTAVNDEGESEPSDSEEITMSEPDVPDAPTGLELKEEADGRLTITWDEVDEATGYIVYVEYKAEDKKWEFARKTCQLKLKGLQAGATYKVYVTAVNEEGESELSASKEITMSEPDVPDAPTGLELKEEADGRLTITWDEVDEATSYIVYVESKEEKKKWEYERKSCGLKLKGLKAGYTYEIYVTAVNDEGESKPSDSEEITITDSTEELEAPSGLDVEEEDEGRVIVSWDEVDEATSYIVYVQCEDEEWEYKTTKCELKFKNLKSGKTYEFSVAAKNSEGVSPRSKTKTITISKAKVPKPPKNLNVEEKSNGSVKVSWDASSGAVGYKVYYKWDNESDFQTYETKNTSCTIKNLAKKDKYEIYVKAYNSAGSSEASESKKKDRDDKERPTKPGTLMGDLRKQGNTYNVYLIWEPSEDNIGVEGYTVYRFNPDNSSDAEKKWSVDADDFDEGDEITTIDKNVKKGQLYIYVVEAYDLKGNKSAFSNAVEISTKDL
ncbi:MAG: fibronectin type III domain-containing protein [Peptococcia bacterium]